MMVLRVVFVSSTPPQLGQSMFQSRSNRPSLVACNRPAMVRSSSRLAECARSIALIRLRSVPHQLLEHIGHIYVSGLTQRRKKGLGFAHAKHIGRDSLPGKASV